MILSLFICKINSGTTIRYRILEYNQIGYRSAVSTKIVFLFSINGFLKYNSLFDYTVYIRKEENKKKVRRKSN